MSYGRHTVLLVLILTMTFWGCFLKKTRVTNPAQPPNASAASGQPVPPAVIPPVVPTKPAPLEPAPIPKTITKTSSYELAELNFQIGNYTKAAQSYESFLSSNPKANHRDVALFHLGMSRALAHDSGRDWHMAEAAFKRLLSEFPQSQYKAQAEFILGQQAQIDKLRSDLKDRDDRIKRLSDELQTYKEIDMQRRPTRP